MARSHFVIIPSDEGGKPLQFPLKRWLRDNPGEIPPGKHPDDSTSHQLRSALKGQGWKLQFMPSEVLVIKPDYNGTIAYAEDLIELKNVEDAAIMSGDEEESEELVFALERDLQSALRQNIDQLEEGLIIIDGGTERTTPAGRIDILAEDAQGNLVIVELKAGGATSRVIAQILAYMASIEDEESKPVRGIIVAGDFDERVRLASRAVPNLELRQYSYQFRFGQVD